MQRIPLEKIDCRLIPARAAVVALLNLLQSSCAIVDLTPSCLAVNEVIDKPGVYCLASHLSTPNGVRIQSDNVVLNLHGFCLHRPNNAATTSTGVYIASNRKGIAIRDGCISNFMYGIKSGAGSSDVTIAGVVLKHSTFRAALLESDNVVFTRNIIDGVGGTEVFEDASTMGIDLRGTNCEVTFNNIREVYPTGSGDSVGIALRNPGKRNCIISDNLVRNSSLSQWGRTYAISFDTPSSIERNIAVRHTYGFSYPRELNFSDSTSTNVSLEETCAPDAAGCPDDVITALATIDLSNRYSVFRVARAYHKLRDYAKAAVYYLAAARLGSQEAERIVLRHLKFGYITEQQKIEAEQQGAQLLAKQH